MYSIFIHVLRLLITLAVPFHTKAALFVSGRKHLLSRLKQVFAENNHPVIWVHVASLGEFEQARPILERIKINLPRHKILLTFYSPSGYEVRKNYSGVDYVFYLPWDYSSHMQRFVNITKPVLAIFIKYEFWKNAIGTLHEKHIPVISVSSIFRSGQVYFQWYGGSQRAILSKISHFFVQNQVSVELLKRIGIRDITHSGDTRFDRVQQLVRSPKSLPFVEKFKSDDKVFVIGSSWPEDMTVLSPFINDEKSLKFIIAPHEINATALKQVETVIQRKLIRYSQIEQDPDAEVLLIDNVGLLSQLYRFGEFAYVGGAFGKGLHNILEAAAYGIPIFFGNKKYQKFQEATDLIMRGGAFEVNDFADLKEKYENVTIPENFIRACETNRMYVEENIGATNKVMRYINQILG